MSTADRNTNRSSVDHRESTLDAIHFGSFDIARQLVHRADFRLAIREACSDRQLDSHHSQRNIMRRRTHSQRLGKKQHVGDLIPRMRVDIGLIAGVDMTRAEFCPFSSASMPAGSQTEDGSLP